MSSSQAFGARAGRVPNDSFFTKRAVVLVVCVAGFLLLNGITAAYVNYDLINTLIEMPGAFAWMLTEFMPSSESLAKLPTILEALLETVLVSVAASAVAALFAYALAVLGSRSVGLGGPFPLIARGIASLFRNIPVVAWALILLFSFKQSEFTGFLALFLTSFGYLTRCFLESIDELAAGPVEALRACGASYGQIIICAVVPLSLTSVVSWLLYMIETNIRDATLVGILTGTGIGFVFDFFYKSFRYDVAGLAIVMIVVVVIACELTSNYVRRKVL